MRLLGLVVAACGLLKTSSVLVTHSLVFQGMWNLLGPGIRPVFPALASGFFPTGPPGKFDAFYFIFISFFL